MSGYLLELAQTGLALLLAPESWASSAGARRGCRTGGARRCWQPYFELRKLFAKEVVVSDNASWLFRAAPFVVFASAVAVDLPRADPRGAARRSMPSAI